LKRKSRTDLNKGLDFNALYRLFRDVKVRVTPVIGIVKISNGFAAVP
jgi:hypothetical protein